MKVIDLINNSKGTAFSFEILPTKHDPQNIQGGFTGRSGERSIEMQE